MEFTGFTTQKGLKTGDQRESVISEHELLMEEDDSGLDYGIKLFVVTCSCGTYWKFKYDLSSGITLDELDSQANETRNLITQRHLAAVKGD